MHQDFLQIHGIIVSCLKDKKEFTRKEFRIHMKIIRKIFEVPESYIQSIKHYSIKDTAMAMGLFILYCGVMAVSGFFNEYLTILERTVSGIIINFCFVGVVLLILVVKKHGIETVGLKKGNIRLSLILSFIRVRSDSLYGAIVPHWISNLSYSIVTHI